MPIIIVKFTFKDGNTMEIIDCPDHPVVKSPLVQNVLECCSSSSSSSEQDEDAVEITLPDFISCHRMDAFFDFVSLSVAGKNVINFGNRYYGRTYQQVYRNHRDYYHWGKRQTAPQGPLKAFLDWGDFQANGRKPSVPHEELLPIAKFFQIDICAGCGVLGKTEGDDDGVTAAAKLTPCRRAKWPRVPILPDYKTVTKDIENWDDQRRAWHEAWKQAEIQTKETGQVVCICDDQLCKSCVSKRGCQICKEWECAECQADSEKKIEAFENWHEQRPDAYEDEDEYGRRPNCRYRPLNSKPCFRCRRRICQSCGYECYECNRLSCRRCKENLNSWCEGCRLTIENNDDHFIGPVDRNEYVCRQCFDSKDMFCGCGEPSYDPRAPSASDSDGASVEYFFIC